MFLRNTCILPKHPEVLVEPFRTDWTHVQRMESQVFDVAIRSAQWHFMWVQESYSRRGIGSTWEAAIHKALHGALSLVSMQFNAAEFDSLHISRLPGLYIANVTIFARHIQEDASMETSSQNHRQSTR